MVLSPFPACYDEKKSAAAILEEGLMENRECIAAIRENVAKAMIGKEETVDLMLCTMLCGGHLLVEDVPGIGKTTLVSALARSMALSFRRIQFTPDLMPSDITGFTMPDIKTGEFNYVAGAAMCQVVLADEINRASPKTQSALLEAMQEGQVTVDGVTHPLPRPFMVLATQNPVEFAGTYPLPEAQLDRFLMCLSLGYPSTEEEMAILERFGGAGAPQLSSVASAQDLLTLQSQVDGVLCAPLVMEYIILLANQTRRHKDLQLGVSPRGSLALMRAAKAWALMQGRDYVLPDDVQRLVMPVWSHRLTARPEALLREMTPRRILQNIVTAQPLPVQK
ncbi:MAG: MoxR family ATPase [Eubacteriales bacterium]|nr:MoxR family ATPase [Eubacteriales bacterium]